MHFPHLDRVSSPRILVEAIRLLGMQEKKGSANNPVILSWAQQLGGSVADAYDADSIPWCGLFVGICAQRAGFALPAEPLWAFNWRHFGNPSPLPSLGDVLVASRNGGGHVTLYAGESEDAYLGVGGNQGDAVSAAWLAKDKVKWIRRCAWRISQPDGVRPVWLTRAGGLTDPGA